MRSQGRVFGRRCSAGLAGLVLGALALSPAGAFGEGATAAGGVEEPRAKASQLAAIGQRMEDAAHAVRTRTLRTRSQVAAGRQPDATLADDALHLRRLVRFLAARLDAEEEGSEVMRLRKLARALEGELGNLDRYARGERPSAAPPLAGPGAAANEARGGSGGISGRVTALPGGAPLFDVEIDVYDSDGFYWDYAYTDAAGNYSIDGLPPGAYHARTYNWQDYFDELYDDLPCTGGCEPTTGTPISVTDGAVTAGIDFALQTGSVITGRVREAGSGLALNAEVTLYDANGYYESYADTDAVGRYRFRGLGSGAYYLRAQSYSFVAQLFDGIDCPAGYCDPLLGDPVTATIGQTTPGIDFSLQSLGSITGTVTDAGTGQPVPFLEVDAQQVDGYGWAYAYTDSGGQYAIRGLSAGTYRVHTYDYGRYRDELYDNVPCLPSGCPLDSATPVSVALDATTPYIDFELDLLGGVSGTVTAAAGGGPIASADVVVYDQDGFYVADGYSDSAGHYRVAGLYPGSYFLTAYRFSYQRELYDGLPCPGYPGVCDPTTGTQVAAALNSDTPGIDFSLQRQGSISGRVTEQATGDPISDCRVEIRNDAGGFVTWTWVDGQGFYIVEGLDAGSYFALTRDCYAYLDELYDDLPCSDWTCDPTAGDAIAVALATETGSIDFALLRLGEIHGRVTDAISGAATYGYVTAWDAEGDFVASTYADSQGYYALQGLEPGTYFVHADGNWNHLGELYDDISCPSPYDCDPPSGTPVPVAIGTVTSGIDFALERGPGLRGTVTAQGDGAPLAGVGIDVWRPDGQLLTSTSTDAAGRYFFDLYEGHYRVSTDAGLGGIDELFDDLACPQGSAYAGLCDPLQGTLVEVTSGLPATADFVLSVASLFADGFETGDLSAWSAVEP